MNFNPQFAGAFGQGPEEEEDMPQFEAVRHPFAPLHLPFAIRDNVSGGFVPGQSPHFPQLFSTAAEANDHIQNYLQNTPFDPTQEAFSQGSSQGFSSGSPAMVRLASSTHPAQAHSAAKGTKPGGKTGSSQTGVGKVQKGIKATVFGGRWDNETSAYNDKVTINDQMMGAGLPARIKGYKIKITDPQTGKTVTVPPVDVGPHYTHDKYWESGKRPRSESDRGSNHAGIDLTPATATALGIPNGVVRHHGVPVKRNGKYVTYGDGTVDWELVPIPKTSPKKH